MPISRKFLDWSDPALPAAVEYLLERFRRHRQWNLDPVLIVVPGSRVGRRLLELLVERAEQDQLVLVPPCIETVGTAPERLYRPKRPFASDLVQQLAWIHALRTAGRNRIGRVIPHLPEDGDVVRWMALGRLLWKSHRELAAEGLDFGDVVESAWRHGEVAEKARWRVLRRVQELYLRVLDHFELWDQQTARLFAIEHQECETDKDIVLLGASDMPVAVRKMLDQVASRVTALVHAPESLQDRFDPHGCIAPDAWDDLPTPLSDDQVVVVEGPADQARAVAESLASWEGWRRADELTIGLPDESLAPHIQRELLQCGVRTRAAVGMRVSQTGPFQLLKITADYLERGRYVDFAALVRHPAIYDFLQHRGSPDGWLGELDRYFSQHVQPRLGQWLGPGEESEAVRQAWELVEQLMRPLRVKSRKVGQWAQRIIDYVVEVYDHIELDRDDPAQHYTLGACRELQTALLQQQAAPPKLTPIVTCWQALRLALEQAAGHDIAPLADDGAIEMLGWLELPLDTAPVLIVTSFNEGRVPTSVNSDLFLPNGLRRRLGLLDNQRRYARDAYALSVLAASREDLLMIAARYDGEGNPLPPSRLLFAVDDDQEAARRALRYFDSERPLRSERAIAGMEEAPELSRLEIPRPPDPAPSIDALAVTAFRTYLECPFRFYLRHVLHLESVRDDAEELDAPAFGSLIHDVLGRFGEGPLRDCDDHRQLREHFRDLLEQCVAEQFGEHRLAPINVQLFQLRARLDAFARWQAEWAREGWQIKFTEAPQGGAPTRLAVDDRELRLFGRIDRIDHHPQRDEWMIFDYKTSDVARSPEQTHRRAGEWVDLQLPLYRRLAEPLGIAGAVRLAYILLPKDVSQVGAKVAEWDAAVLDSADETAREVARRVLDGCFWPPADVRSTYDDYADICQRGVFDRRAAAPTADAGEPAAP